jgi:hypothetical protein
MFPFLLTLLLLIQLYYEHRISAALLESISSTFYVRIFHTKVNCAAFL